MPTKSLQSAKAAKNDEFYTRFDDVQKELNYYRDQFKNKVIYCNCDDPSESAFADFFKLNFDHFGLKKLICTRYSKSQLFLLTDPIKKYGFRLEITGRNNSQKIDLKGDGDFRSPECIDFLKEADIVCTNPPFSLFREYIAQLVEYEKKFLIIGNKNAISYKEIFPLIAQNKIWLGYTSPDDFIQPDGQPTKNMKGLTRWFTNLDVTKRHEELVLYETYTPKKYPKYANFDAINVNKSTEIPAVERDRTKELAERNPDHASFLNNMIERMYDLEDVFKKRYHVDPGFKGRTSIKKVLPVLVPDLKYDGLNIREGATAFKKWFEMVSGSISDKEKNDISKNLKDYCCLDTYAMYAIWKCLMLLVRETASQKA